MHTVNTSTYLPDDWWIGRFVDHISFEFLPTINITLLAIEAKKQPINTQMTKNYNNTGELKFVEHKPFGGNEVSVVESLITLRE